LAFGLSNRNEAGGHIPPAAARPTGNNLQFTFTLSGMRKILWPGA
jgi:hypothetical protein